MIFCEESKVNGVTEYYCEVGNLAISRRCDKYKPPNNRADGVRCDNYGQKMGICIAMYRSES